MFNSDRCPGSLHLALTVQCSFELRLQALFYPLLTGNECDLVNLFLLCLMLSTDFLLLRPKLHLQPCVDLMSTSLKAQPSYTGLFPPFLKPLSTSV